MAEREGQLALAVLLSEDVGEDETVLLPDADEVALGDADALHHEHVAERLASGVALGQAEPELDGDALGEDDSVTLEDSDGCVVAVTLPLAVLLADELARSVGVAETTALPEIETLALPETVGAADDVLLAVVLPDALAGADRDGRSDLLAAQLAVVAALVLTLALALALALVLTDAWPPAPRSAASSSSATASSGWGPAIRPTQCF